MTCQRLQRRPGFGIRSRAVTMEDIARDVSGWTDRPIVDKTGLEGLYELNTYIGADSLPIPGPSTPLPRCTTPPSPSIFTIFERLSLKLSPPAA
jgi:uncharacterized protein (TIGR03435 family)